MTTSRLSRIALVLAIYFVGLMQSFESHASSCRFATKKMADERSQKYKDRVQIEITKYNTEYFVEVFLPPKVEVGPLRGVSLIKGSHANGTEARYRDFTIFLKVTEREDGRMYSSYRLKYKFAKGIYIAASYGGGCGFGIQYLVDFGESVEQ